jgi:uncharacterized protein YjbI with pentapeptide repeats
LKFYSQTKSKVGLMGIAARTQLERVITEFRNNETNEVQGPDVAAWLRDNVGTRNISEFDLRGIDLAFTNLQHAVIEEADLLGAILEGANLQNAVMTRSTLMGASLININARHADCTEVDFRGANFRNADFTAANLTRADVRDVRNFNMATYQGAVLRDIYFKGMDLLNADFESADLRGADLRETNLKGVNFQGANLKDTDLKAACLGGATLTYAKGLTLEQLLQAFQLRAVIIDPADQENAQLLARAIQVQGEDPRQEEGAKPRLQLVGE